MIYWLGILLYLPFHFMNEEHESKIFCQYFPNLPNNNLGRGVLKIVAGPILNLLTQNIPERSLDLSDSQAKG